MKAASENEAVSLILCLYFNYWYFPFNFFVEISFVSMCGSEKNQGTLDVSNSVLCSSSGDCRILTGSGAHSEEGDPVVRISLMKREGGNSGCSSDLMLHWILMLRGLCVCSLKCVSREWAVGE